jgi:multidrug efflux pump subunit AcrB/outer membrane protein TolC
MLSQVFPQFRLTLTIAFLLTVLGILGFVTIPKEEDPHLKNRWGWITVVYPGAQPERLEEWVISPLEKELRSLTEIKSIETVIRPQFAGMALELNDNVQNIEEVWNEVQRKMDETKPKFPEGVSEFLLDRRITDLEAIIISLESDDLESLSRMALKLKQDLLSVPSTKEIVLHGDPEFGFTVRTSAEKLARSGLGIAQIVQQIQQSNLSTSAGIYQGGDINLMLQTPSTLSRAEEIKNLPILFQSLQTIPLSQIADVIWEPATYPQEKVRVNGRPAIVLGIVPSHPIDILKWGKDVRAFLKKYPFVSHIKWQELSYLPERTKERMLELAESLVIGMLSVVGVLGLWMGWRIGLVVALSVPVISVIGFGFYYLLGGVLHQMSLAALLLSLGQFIDNVTVVAESVQRKVDEGMDPALASLETSQNFRFPMIFATGTAIASFLPMLASEGATAEFTLAIPLIAIITLLVSWFFALQATPVMTALLLKKSKKGHDFQKHPFFQSLFEKTFSRPFLILGVTFCIGIISLGTLFLVKKDFFPSADRNEFVMRLEMPAGTSLERTDQVARKLEDILQKDSRVKIFSTYVGKSTPLFFYSVLPDKRISDVAEFYVTTHHEDANEAVAKHAEIAMLTHLPQGAVLYTRQLMQGPPVKAAIVLELFGEDLQKMSQSLYRVMEASKNIPGAINVRTDAPRFLPLLKFDLDEGRFLENGSDRNQFAWTLLAWSQGIEATYFFKNGDRFPIRVELDNNPKKKSESLKKLKILPTLNKDYLLEEVSSQREGFSATSIQHVGGQRVIRLLSDVAPGVGLNEVEPRLLKLLEDEAQSGGWRVVRGGQAKESQSANLAILRAMPLGLLLLTFCLLFEFKSFRKLALVLVSVSIVSLGVIPGLYLGQQPFGFMSLLGLLALVGIVVNNAILIIEAIESHAESQAFSTDSLLMAIKKALELRTRPILMTTLMTLIGLLPLAFENSTLWPPMAWAMISGLLVSTFISLFFLPAAYLVLFRQDPSPPIIKPALALGLLLFAFSFPSHTKDFSLEDIEKALKQSPLAEISHHRQEAQDEKSESVFRETYLPKVRLQFDRTMNDRDLSLLSPLGSSPYGRRAYWNGGAEIEQPLFLPAQMLYAQPAATESHEAEKFSLKREKQTHHLQTLIWALSVQEIEHQLELLEVLKSNLQKQAKEVDRLITRGRAAPSDGMKVEVELETLERQIVQMRNDRDNLLRLLKIRVPGLETVKKENLPPIESNEQEVMSVAVTNRADFLALHKEILATEFQKKAELNSVLPEIRFFGRYFHTDQGFLAENDWYSVGIQLRWELWDGGARYSRASAAIQERLALEKEKLMLTQQIQSEQRFIQAERLRFIQDARVYERTAKKTQDILNKEREAYTFGKVTLNQVLDAERLWVEQRRNLVRSVFGLKKSYYEQKYAYGEE